METTEQMGTEEFKSQTMLVRLEKHQLSTTITDKQTSEEVRLRKGVSSKGGTWKKKLFTKGYEDIRSIFNEVSKVHGRYTIPYSNDGFAMLRAELYETYKQEMDSLKVRLDDAVDAFVTTIDGVIENDRLALGETFDFSDYPSESEIRERCSIEYTFQALPNLNGVKINSFSMADLVKENERRLKEVMESATQKPLEQLLELTEKIRVTLGDPEKVFRNSLIGNLQETLDAVHNMNVTNSPVVEQAAAQARAMLNEIGDLEALRKNKEFRSMATNRAAETAERIGKVVAQKIKK